MRRAVTAFIGGLIVTVVLLPFVARGLALTGGWGTTALAFLLPAWSVVIRGPVTRCTWQGRRTAHRGCC
jgi:hypothetical protein